MYPCAHVHTYTLIIITIIVYNNNEHTLKGKMNIGDIGGSRHGGG